MPLHNDLQVCRSGTEHKGNWLIEVKRFLRAVFRQTVYKLLSEMLVKCKDEKSLDKLKLWKLGGWAKLGGRWAAEGWRVVDPPGGGSDDVGGVWVTCVCRVPELTVWAHRPL